MLNKYRVAGLSEIVKNRKIYSPTLAQLLRDDKRIAAKNLGKHLDKINSRMETRVSLFREMKDFDDRHRYRWGGKLAGVDEAGRGPAAGPVVAASVLFSPVTYIFGLDDSKKISPNTRKKLFCLIHRYAESVSVAIIAQEEIDKINILQATLKAMARSMSKLHTEVDAFLIDGTMRASGVKKPQIPIVGGDSKSLAIAAASIVAKVTRDWIMDICHFDYPEYMFNDNKGYLTTEHLEVLQRKGPCPLHRMSFAPVKRTNVKGGNLF